MLIGQQRHDRPKVYFAAVTITITEELLVIESIALKTGVNELETKQHI